mgnify:CR=1 FL=1|jgi:hypothetical protein
MHSALETLGIQQINNSSCIGGHWCGDTRLDVFESINPSDLKCLAMIRPSTEPEYQDIIA